MRNDPEVVRSISLIIKYLSPAKLIDEKSNKNTILIQVSFELQGPKKCYKCFICLISCSVLVYVRFFSTGCRPDCSNNFGL